jgi:hypothetical protein
MLGADRDPASAWASAVHAESVRVEQGGIGRAEAHQVNVTEGGRRGLGRQCHGD